MTEDSCPSPNGNIGGVSLREYITLLIEKETQAINLVLMERMGAVNTAFETHQTLHAQIEKDMEHLNELRQDVLKDRAQYVLINTFDTYRDSMSSWVTLMGSQLSSLRGQIVGAGAILTVVFAVVQIAIAIYR